jgi:hypothetical protein
MPGSGAKAAKGSGEKKLYGRAAAAARKKAAKQGSTQGQAVGDDLMKVMEEDTAEDREPAAAAEAAEAAAAAAAVPPAAPAPLSILTQVMQAAATPATPAAATPPPAGASAAPSAMDVATLRRFFGSHDHTKLFESGPPTDEELQGMIDGNSTEELRELLVDEYGEAPAKLGASAAATAEQAAPAQAGRQEATAAAAATDTATVIATAMDVATLRRFFGSHDHTKLFESGPPTDEELQGMIDGNSTEELRELLVDEYGEAP